MTRMRRAALGALGLIVGACTGSDDASLQSVAAANGDAGVAGAGGGAGAAGSGGGTGGASGGAPVGGGGSGATGTTSDGGAGGSTGGTGAAGGSSTASGGSGGSPGTGGHGGAAICAAPAGPVGRCGDPHPAGAASPPPPPAYGGGACPTLAPGINGISSSGNQRTFILVVPTDHDGLEPLPLVFLWHWLGGDANGFLTKGEVQAAVDQMRFAAVIPEAKDDALNIFKWPYSIVDLPSRQAEEATFFDDMFACVTQQYPIDLDCVASAGVSAGALWTDQLAGLRGEYLSSIMSLSGGVGGLVKPWNPPVHKMPAFVLWGGPADQCVTIQFQATSQALQAELTADCHFQVECVHNCAHAEPPFDTPPGMSKYAALWRFFLDHPYWLEPGASPWLQDGIPSGSPEWCGIGPGSATPRLGDCPPPACPI